MIYSLLIDCGSSLDTSCSHVFHCLLYYLNQQCASAQYPGVYSRISEVNWWIQEQIQKYSDYDTPASPNPPPPPSPTPQSPPPPPPSPPSSSITMLREDFKNGSYGKMSKGGVHVRIYDKARGELGVIRLQHGRGQKSATWTVPMSNNRSSSRNTRGATTWKVTFRYYGNGMEENEGFCVQYQEDNGQYKDAKCYESGKDFENGVWIDEEITIDISDSTKDVRFRWINEGNERSDDTLISWIQIDKQA